MIARRVDSNGRRRAQSMLLDPWAMVAAAVRRCLLELLRLEILSEVGVEDARAYRAHDLRRGHALDLQLLGTS